MKKYIDILTIGELTNTAMAKLKAFRRTNVVVSVRPNFKGETRNVAGLKACADIIINSVNGDEESLLATNSLNETSLIKERQLEEFIKDNLVPVKTDREVFVVYTLAKESLNTFPSSVKLSMLLECDLVSKIFINVSNKDFPNGVKDFPTHFSKLLSSPRVQVLYNEPGLFNELKVLGMVDEDSYVIFTDSNTLISNQCITKAVKIAEGLYKNEPYITEETDNTLFGTKVASPQFTLIKPKMVGSLIFEGATSSLVKSSPLNWWLTFNLWYSGLTTGAYSTQFDIKNTISAEDREADLVASEFYSNLARMGIKKLFNK